jgi:diaminopimelate epimerase
MELAVADPARNITVFVRDPPEAREERLRIARAILADGELEAEQVGFVYPPVSGGLWSLEMMGGEFCGNAARSFGLYAALEEGRRGRVSLSVRISGMEGPVTVNVDTLSGWAEAEMPRPEFFDSLDWSAPVSAAQERALPVVVFAGITHIIAPDIPASGETFRAIQERYERKISAAALPAALGVLFRGSRFMRPAVYVRDTDSLVFESSCGSGSAAIAAWESRALPDGEACYAIAQPGGVIETRVLRKAGENAAIYIGGAVGLKRLRWPR